MAVKARIRFDFKATTSGRKFFWQRQNLREIATDLRSQQASILKNMPFQGLNVENLDLDQEVYIIQDGADEVAFAPVELVVEADSIEDLMPLTLREEFRKIKVLEPNQISLSNGDVERLLFKVNEEYRDEILCQD
ncbi:MAG: hypothetical protein GX075_03550 [Firmicutes bacterium]|nr:hypothetical protein [Bacillota bacterium]